MEEASAVLARRFKLGRIFNVQFRSSPEGPKLLEISSPWSVD
jgi:hypothetical protein